MSRPDYNHRTWPSPRARLVAIKLGLDVMQRYPLIKMKRLTHAQAIELLAKKLNKTIPEFLAMPKDEAWLALGCYTTSSWNPSKVPYDPLYGPRKYY